MSSSATQRALLLSAEKTYYVGETPVPTPGPLEVLVKIEATALNPIDWKVTGGPRFSAIISKYPHVCGFDGAGVVERVGSEVVSLAEGDKILFQGWAETRSATFQQHCVIPARFTAKIPAGISYDQAASVPLGLATVVFGVYSTDPRASAMSLGLTPFWEPAGANVSSGKPILIMGGASSVGQYAIQVAKLAGFSPIITTASLSNAPLLQSIGATNVLDRSLPSQDILSAISVILAGAPLEIAFDAVTTSDTVELAYTALAPRGRLAITLPNPLSEDVKAAGAAAGKTIVETVASPYLPQHSACGEALFARLADWLARGDIKPNNVEVLPGGLAGIPAGLKRLEKGVSAVKLISRPHETA